jgi:hypothetical protein
VRSCEWISDHLEVRMRYVRKRMGVRDEEKEVRLRMNVVVKEVKNERSEIH